METVRHAVDEWIGANLPGVRPGKDLVTRVALAPGSEEFRRVYAEGETEIASNDTSGASGYAPLSPTEELVLATERYLNSREFKVAFPDTGQDVKVMGVRHDQRLAVTVAMPLACLHTRSEAAYFARKDEVLHALTTRFASAPFTVDWQLNCLDRRGLGLEGVYLTLSGTSAEDADSGQVGRGNRANGLIAFSRPTGGEATAGKNPAAHAGKVYSALSHRPGAPHPRLVPEAPRGLRAHGRAHRRAGGSTVDGRQVLLPPGTALEDVEREIREVVDAEQARLPAFRTELIRGDHLVC